MIKPNKSLKLCNDTLSIFHLPSFMNVHLIFSAINFYENPLHSFITYNIRKKL